LGQKVYKYAEAMNRVNNALLEGVILGSCVMFQPNTAADAEKLKTVQIGPYRILPPGLNLTQASVSSNLSAAMQTAQFFQGQESDDIGSFMPSVAGGGRKKGNREIEMEIGEKSRLTNTRAEIYLQALDVHYREVYRRASNPNLIEEDHGGAEALRFQKACLERGVPAAAMLDIDSVKATRSIGQGSSAARMQAMELIGQYLPQLPESNRKRVINANIAAIAGQTGVETFGIPEEVKPEGNDLSISSLENNALQSGGQVLIDPDQNHVTHMAVHSQFANQLISGLQNQQVDPIAVNTALQGLMPHMLGHLKFIEEDPTRSAQFDAMSNDLNELMKIADQVSRMALDMQQRQMDEMQQQQQQQIQDPKMAVAMNKIELDRMKFQNDAQIKQAKAQHQMQLQDRRTAQRLMVDKLELAQKYGSNQP
jgi:hypothetical protein